MLSEAKKEKLFFWADILHRRFFGVEMSGEVRNFLANLSWSFFGGIVAAGILFGMNIFAGRVLGPEEYGKYNFIAAFAASALLIMTLGLDVTTLHFIAKNKEKQKINEYLGTSFFVVITLALVVTLSISFFSDLVIEKYTLQRETFYLALFFTIILTLKNLTDSYLRGLSLFKMQGQYKILEAVAVAGIFLAVYWQLFSSITVTHASFLGTLIFAAGIIIVLVLFQVRESLRFKFFSLQVLSEMLHYGAFVLLGGIASALLLNSDKLLIGQFLGNQELGLYSAYYIASMTFTTYIAVIFINVFFPKVSEIGIDKKAILKKINTLVPFMVIPGFIAVTLVTRGALLLFGKNYQVDWILIAEFSGMSLLFVYFSVIWWLIAASGVKGVRFTSVTGLVIGLLFIANVTAFQAWLSISLVVLFLVVSVIIGIVLGNYVLIKKIIV